MKTLNISPVEAETKIIELLASNIKRWKKNKFSNETIVNNIKNLNLPTHITKQALIYSI